MRACLFVIGIHRDPQNVEYWGVRTVCKYADGVGAALTASPRIRVNRGSGYAAVVRQLLPVDSEAILVASTRSREEQAVLKAAIIERYTTTDAAMNAIAVDLGCDPTYVRRVLLANGISLVDKPRRERRDRFAHVDRDREIAALYDGGMGAADIGIPYGLSGPQVAYIARKMEASRRATALAPYRSSPERDAAIIAAHVAGQPKREIAEQFGLSVPRIVQIVAEARRRGIPTDGPTGRPTHSTRRRPKRPDQALRDQQIVELYNAFVPVKDIATRTGLTRSSISKIAKEMGCPPRRADGRNRQHDARNREIVAVRAAGVQVSVIAQQFTLSASYVWRILGEAKHQSSLD